MTSIASAPALLHAALQDLRAGKRDAISRLRGLADRAASPELAVLFRQETARAEAQADRLSGTGLTGSKPVNLWMKGILDDAERDTRQTQPGPLLDVALIGAVRKAKAAEIVSSETATGLADQLGQQAAGAAVRSNRAEEIATDRALKVLLLKLTRG